MLWKSGILFAASMYIRLYCPLMKKFSIPVVCVCLFSILYSCKKSDKHPDYSANMGGVREWVGVNMYSTYWVPAGPPLYVDTGRRTIESSFALKIEGGAVVVWGNPTKLYYNREDPMAKAVIYSNRPETPADETDIEFFYFYERDSMAYRYSSWHHQYGSTTEMHTK